MLDMIVTFLTAVAVLGNAVVAGVFLTFSELVMPALGAVRGAGPVEAMQVINRKVFRTVFMVLLFAMMALAPVLAVLGLAVTGGAAGWWMVAGGLAYIAGVMAVTVRGNVPMNERLDRMEAGAAETAAYWQVYLRGWTRWNSVRTAASALAAACYLAALAG